MHCQVKWQICTTKTYIKHVVSKAGLLRTLIFWHMTPCLWISVSRHRKERVPFVFMGRYGGYTIVRNVGKHQPMWVSVMYQNVGILKNAVVCVPAFHSVLTFWRRNYFFLILANSVYRMWIILEPNMVELWNKLHFEAGKNGEYIPCLEYSVPIFVE